MITDPPPQSSALPPPSSKASDNGRLLALNPGVPRRKARSTCKLCLWLLGIIVITFGSLGVYLLVTQVFNWVQNPYRSMYYDEKGKGEGEVKDWSQVVKPMMTKDSKFDVVASVWVQDDTLTDSEKDAGLMIDDEERPEKLIFAGKVFKNVDVNSNVKFANVKLRIPTNHFRQANLSNYDVRASFVLVQSDENRPSWLDFAKNFTSWKPQSLKVPSVRKHGADLTLEDKIYDSFGISIPLIEFHNITSNRSGSINDTLLVETSAATENTTHPDVESPAGWDEEPDWDEEGATESQVATSTVGEKAVAKNGRNTFRLEFVGEKRPITEYHPYVVTRTHLRIMKQDRLFKRLPYIKAQKLVANKTCVDSAGRPIQDPRWYECYRLSSQNGVFETKVQLRLPPFENTGTKIDKKLRTEWLYAPYMSAMQRAAGPMDIIPIHIDRENYTQTKIDSSDEEFVTMDWKLTFSGHTEGKLLLLDAPVFQGHVHNMTETESLLQSAQREHDMKMGIYGHRIDEDAHPRRNIILGAAPGLIGLFCWPLVIYYWYTRTITTGISRVGTALLCLGSLLETLEELLVFVFGPENRKSGIAKFLILLEILEFIQPFVMMVAILRLEFSWSTGKKRSERGDGRTYKTWIPRIYIAKASHSERASERFEARLTKRAKLLIFVASFAAVHFFMTPKSYLLSPTFSLPEAAQKHPLESFSSHVPTIAKHHGTLITSCILTGHILQFVMNYSSQTYAGNYKITAMLLLIFRAITFLDLLPFIVGTTLRTNGVTVSEGVLVVIRVVDCVQAVKYRYAKSLDGEDEE